MTDAMTTEKFASLYELELDVQRAHATEGFGIDADTRARAKADKEKAIEKLFEVAMNLPEEERPAYAEYRLARKAAE